MEFQKHVNENYKLLRNFKYLKGKKGEITLNIKTEPDLFQSKAVANFP